MNHADTATTHPHPVEMYTTAVHRSREWNICFDLVARVRLHFGQTGRAQSTSRSATARWVSPGTLDDPFRPLCGQKDRTKPNVPVISRARSLQPMRKRFRCRHLSVITSRHVAEEVQQLCSSQENCEIAPLSTAARRCRQIRTRDVSPSSDANDSPVLWAGDSFSRISEVGSIW